VQAVFLLRAVTAADGGAGIARSAPVLASWGALSIAVYVFNGLTDRVGDRANGSRRPLARGSLSPRTASWAIALLSVAGICGCWLARPAVVPLALAFLLLGWAYSAGPALKKHPVGFAVAVGGGAALTYAAGWVAAGCQGHATLVFGLAMSVWVGCACGVKDFSDVTGDRLAGRGTWPVRLGMRRAVRLLCGCIAAALAVMLACSIVVPVVLPATLVVGAGSAALAVACRQQGRRAAGQGAEGEEASGGRLAYRIFLCTQYAANLAFAVAVAA
jgi:4-hydroxybenzoate polyprenyltransferase